MSHMTKSIFKGFFGKTIVVHIEISAVNGSHWFKTETGYVK